MRLVWSTKTCSLEGHLVGEAGTAAAHDADAEAGGLGLLLG
jgi:hypothetical protein